MEQTNAIKCVMPNGFEYTKADIEQAAKMARAIIEKAKEIWEKFKQAIIKLANSITKMFEDLAERYEAPAARINIPPLNLEPINIKVPTMASQVMHNAPRMARIRNNC